MSFIVRPLLRGVARSAPRAETTAATHATESAVTSQLRSSVATSTREVSRSAARSEARVAEINAMQRGSNIRNYATGAATLTVAGGATYGTVQGVNWALRQGNKAVAAVERGAENLGLAFTDIGSFIKHAEDSAHAIDTSAITGPGITVVVVLAGVVFAYEMYRFVN